MFILFPLSSTCFHFTSAPLLFVSLRLKQETAVFEESADRLQEVGKCDEGKTRNYHNDGIIILRRMHFTETKNIHRNILCIHIVTESSRVASFNRVPRRNFLLPWQCRKYDLLKRIIQMSFFERGKRVFISMIYVNPFLSFSQFNFSK